MSELKRFNILIEEDILKNLKIEAIRQSVKPSEFSGTIIKEYLNQINTKGVEGVENNE